MKLYGNKRKGNAKGSGWKAGFKNWKTSTKILLVALVAVLAIILIIAAVVKSQVRPPVITPVPPSNMTPPSGEPGSTPNPGGGEEDPEISGVEPMMPEGRKEGFFTFILAGTDLDDYHTDTLMVASYDSVNKKLHVVSVPRDTQVNVPSWTIKKINSAYGVGGISRLKRELKKIIGFEPDFHAVVSLEGFVKVIDAIGGVEFDVPMKMTHADPKPELRINLQKGVQPLDGAKALQLVRFRGYPEGDIKRVQVQQSFMKALAKQLLKVQNIPKIPTFVNILEEYMETDLELGHMAWFAQEIMKLDSAEDIEFHMLPGNSAAWYNGQSYHTLYKNQVVEMVNKYLNPYTNDVSAKNLDIINLTGDDRPIASPSPSPSPKPGEDDDDDDDETPPTAEPPLGTAPPTTEPTQPPGVEPTATQTPATDPPVTQTPVTQTPAPPTYTPPPGPTMEPTRPPS